MKILWLCAVVTADIAKALNMPVPFYGGWLQGAAAALSADPNIQLQLCFPQSLSPSLLQGETAGIRYFGFPAAPRPYHEYDPQLESYFSQILEIAQPDMVHIWGTEFPQTLAMTKVYGKPDRTLISIQGLCSFIAEHYTAFLPETICRGYTFRDLLRRDRICDQQKKFRLRGRMETQALQNAGHVIGRTRWDKACARQLAPQARYHFCNETLRSNFYEKAGTWTVDTCQKHSIFVSQAGYPLKGFHQVLAAMPQILAHYPDSRLYTTGTDPFSIPFYRLNGYQKYLKQQITRLKLRDKVTFLGDLDAQTMCDRFLSSHVFVSASSIENSPNSVGEAMLLGVPTVASFVGGTMDLLEDGKDGFLYQADAPYLLADRVCALFADDALAIRLGQNATTHAQKTHDPQTNLNSLLKIYKEILNHEDRLSV